MFRFTRQPYPDELLSPWLERVAAVYGTSWSDLRKTNGYLDIVDYGNEPETFEFLARLTRVCRPTIEALDLAVRFPHQQLHRFACHPTTRRAVVEVCEACFADDIEEGRDNYLRYQWAVAGVSHCEKHGRLLRTTCPNCRTEFSVQLALAGGAVRACCVGCKQRLPFPDYGKPQDADDLADFIVQGEKRVLAAMRGAPRHASWLRVVEDLAFLHFYEEMPQIASAVKYDLGRWGREVAGLVTPALEKERLIYDRSFLFPLATTRSNVKAHLFASAMVLAEGRRAAAKIMLSAERELTLRSLFLHLSDGGREEFVRRASQWTQSLQNIVREIAHEPLAAFRCGRCEDREPWAKGQRRRDANGGKIPVYEHL